VFGRHFDQLGLDTIICLGLILGLAMLAPNPMDGVGAGTLSGGHSQLPRAAGMGGHSSRGAPMPCDFASIPPNGPERRGQLAHHWDSVPASRAEKNRDFLAGLPFFALTPRGAVVCACSPNSQPRNISCLT